jgi:hypothetical protein
MAYLQDTMEENVAYIKETIIAVICTYQLETLMLTQEENEEGSNSVYVFFSELRSPVSALYFPRETQKGPDKMHHSNGQPMFNVPEEIINQPCLMQAKSEVQKI